MHKMNSRWGVLIKGENATLESLKAKINGSVKSPQDFFISMAGGEYLLRSSRWDGAPDPTSAMHLAYEDVAVISGCLDILERRSGIAAYTIFEFREDGLVNQTAMSETRMPLRPKADCTPGMFKRLMLAANSHALREAVKDFHAEESWHGIFKAFEGIKKYYGDENKLFRAFPQQKANLIRLRQTANSYRHTAKAFDPVANPIRLFAAKALLETIFESIAAAQPYPNSHFPGGQVQVDDYSELPVMWLDSHPSIDVVS